jgi:hypothetical protein
MTRSAVIQTRPFGTSPDSSSEDRLAVGFLSRCAASVTTKMALSKRPLFDKGEEVAISPTNPAPNHPWVLRSIHSSETGGQYGRGVAHSSPWVEAARASANSDFQKTFRAARPGSSPWEDYRKWSHKDHSRGPRNVHLRHSCKYSHASARFPRFHPQITEHDELMSHNKSEKSQMRQKILVQ